MDVFAELSASSDGTNPDVLDEEKKKERKKGTERSGQKGRTY